MPKLKNLKQIDGKVEKFIPTTLDQVWGATATKYGTEDAAEYEAQLREMNMTDLQRHAISHDTVPGTNRERLIKKLIGEFKRYVGSFKMPQSKAVLNPEQPAPDHILKILAEGR